MVSSYKNIDYQSVTNIKLRGLREFSDELPSATLRFKFIGFRSICIQRLINTHQLSTIVKPLAWQIAPTPSMQRPITNALRHHPLTV